MYTEIQLTFSELGGYFLSKKVEDWFICARINLNPDGILSPEHSQDWMALLTVDYFQDV